MAKKTKIEEMCTQQGFDSILELIAAAKNPNTPLQLRMDLCKFLAPYQHGVPAQKLNVNLRDGTGISKVPMPMSAEEWSKEFPKDKVTH